jgi:hypothetical protein
MILQKMETSRIKVASPERLPMPLTPSAPWQLPRGLKDSGQGLQRGVSLIPRVNFKASKSYGRLYLRNWTSELNLTPPRYVQGGEGVFEANSTAKAFYNALLCTSNSSETT